MSRRFVARCPVLASLGVLLLTASVGSQQVPQPTQKIKPTLQPVAETRLIMEGLANANFRGLEKLLKEEPASVQAWTFARGQALLIAETSNLLLIRPPKGEAQNIWFENAMTLRVTATQLAAAAAEKDYAKAKGLFLSVAKSCNSCHSTFSVPVQIQPFAQAGQFKDVKFE
jgi:hypothetical protein